MQIIKQKKLSIIFPVYNEQESLPHVFEALKGFIPKLSEIDIAVEIIFVDDHSTDRSPELLAAHCHNSDLYRYVRLSKNSGNHIAVIAGFYQSRGDCSVFLAADLQDPLELIIEMVRKWQQGYQIVWAIRSRIEGVSRSERTMSSLFYKLFNKFGEVSLPPSGADFALLDRRAMEAMKQAHGTVPSLGAILSSLGFKSTEIEYVKKARKFGKSKWNWSKRVTAAIDAFVSFSFAPMRLMSYIGFIFAFFGFLYAVFVLIIRIAGAKPIQGWSSLMVVVLIIGGIQMIMLGILGEYLWRTLAEAKNKPLFFIESSSDSAEVEDNASVSVMISQ